MPLVWKPNTLFLEHAGVRIFHVYKDDSAEDITHSFGTASDTSDQADDTCFDVRMLPSWKSALATARKETPLHQDVRSNAIRIAIKTAIDAGDLQQYIEAANLRPTDIEGAQLSALDGSGLRAMLNEIHIAATAHIVAICAGIRGESEAPISMTGDAIEYSLDEVFHLDSIHLETNSQGRKFLIVELQANSGGESRVFYLDNLDAEFAVDVLCRLEEMYPDAGGAGHDVDG